MSSIRLWELHQWAVPQLAALLPLNDSELEQVLEHTESLSDSEGARHLRDLLGDSPEALRFINSFYERRADMKAGASKGDSIADGFSSATTKSPPPPTKNMNDTQNAHAIGKVDKPVPAPVQQRPSSTGRSSQRAYNHTNVVTQAAEIRARDEQEMQQLLQNLQYQYQIYNSDIEPEHETDYYCRCPIHQYKARKYQRYGVQDMWSRAVMYPGEKSYNDNQYGTVSLFSGNPYMWRIQSPYGYRQVAFYQSRPIPSYHARSINQTIDLNNRLNREAQANIDAKEPNHSIWEDNALENAMSNLSLGDKKQALDSKDDYPSEKGSSEKRQSLTPSGPSSSAKPKASRFSSFRKSVGIKSSDERATNKLQKSVAHGSVLRDDILDEEQGRWPDEEWRNIVDSYQDKVGMRGKIAALRARQPIQYLHLLRAGYFEPIPVAWANQASNPLKFSIEAAAGWRGITPAWRGYEDTAEERLYWVLNHREGPEGTVKGRMKPDFISELNMARERMARAVEPPPLYYSASDTCHVQHTSDGYSKQVMPPPFMAFDRPEQPTDDTMILLDVSGSMDFDPLRPMYDRYMVTGFAPSRQPKNKDVAKAIVRRFTDAMANHDHSGQGYDLTTFANKANYIGTINHQNLDRMWRNVRFGGGTRVMTGWQKVKELHFQKHSASAIHHPVYGWQAGPETPILRLLLLLDGEATDMDEFELDLLGLSWAHVTIFLIGVDGCPHHHRHANELQRISDVNHHVSFVDAQGNCPERFVTHELLKRHLGYDISMQEFEQMEELPPYSAV